LAARKEDALGRVVLKNYLGFKVILLAGFKQQLKTLTGVSFLAER
jgi:hypothetical protein